MTRGFLMPRKEAIFHVNPAISTQQLNNKFGRNVSSIIKNYLKTIFTHCGPNGEKYQQKIFAKPN